MFGPISTSEEERSLFYSREQGNSTYNFFIQNKHLIAEVVKNDSSQLLRIENLPVDLQTELNEEKLQKLIVIMDQCFFSTKGEMVLVTARGKGGWCDEQHRGYELPWYYLQPRQGTSKDAVSDEERLYKHIDSRKEDITRLSRSPKSTYEQNKGEGTYSWTKFCGFSEEQATIIAESCVAVDGFLGGMLGATAPASIPAICVDDTDRPQSWHFNTLARTTEEQSVFNGTLLDSRIQHALNCLRMAVGYTKVGGDEKNKKALCFLGFGLHALQDVFAHSSAFVTTADDYKIGGFYIGVQSHWLTKWPGEFADTPIFKPELVSIAPCSIIYGETMFNQRYSDTKTVSIIYLMLFLYNSSLRPRADVESCIGRMVPRIGQKEPAIDGFKLSDFLSTIQKEVEIAIPAQLAQFTATTPAVDTPMDKHIRQRIVDEMLLEAARTNDLSKAREAILGGATLPIDSSIRGSLPSSAVTSHSRGACGWNALHWAVYEGNVGIILCILASHKCRLQINATTSTQAHFFGRGASHTALHLLQRSRLNEADRLGVARMLIMSGADPMKMDSNGNNLVNLLLHKQDIQCAVSRQGINEDQPLLDAAKSMLGYCDTFLSYVEELTFIYRGLPKQIDILNRAKQRDAIVCGILKEIVAAQDGKLSMLGELKLPTPLMEYARDQLRKEQLLIREIEQFIQSPTIPRAITTVKIIREKIGGHHFECIHGVRTRVNTTKDHNRSETTVAVDKAATSQVIETFLNQLNPKLDDLLKCIKEQYEFYSDIVRCLSCIFYIYRRPNEPGPGSPPSTVSPKDVAGQLGGTIRSGVAPALVVQALLDIISFVHESRPGETPPYGPPSGGTPETGGLCTAASLASSMAMGGGLIN